MTATDPVQAVAEALTEHRPRLAYAFICTCGYVAGGFDDLTLHLSRAVVAAARPLIAAEAALTEAVSLIAALRGWADDDAAAGQAKSAHALRFAASMIEANALPVLRDRADDLEAGR